MKYFNIPIKGVLYPSVCLVQCCQRTSEYKDTTIFYISKIFLDFFKKYLEGFVYY